ncbi:HEPN domain-containing protein [Algoriphagus mannitolivorans]|uniref:HEPN domain-containing protein n=1 Tax=Algoriphagus mannitolivorans TaxID=226504 RepID=UPI0009FC8C8E|nr:HEPN domain-containing protein [Algoriphagus mannitolivorans]
MTGASEDLEVAEILIEERRFLHGLFFCHLVIEKAIKAHVVKVTGELAPKSHNLIYLSEKSELLLKDETLEFFGVLMKYQLEGRYPGYQPFIPEYRVVQDYLRETKMQLSWLKERLSNY